MLNKKFGRWTVIEEGKHKDYKVLCRCDCGKERRVRTDGLKNGSSVSCGCFHKEVTKRLAFKNRLKIGDKFNKLTVIGLIKNEKQRTYYYNLICDCGDSPKPTRAEALIKGKVKSCGCLARERTREMGRRPKPKKPIDVRILYAIRNHCKNNAKARGIYFNLTIEDVNSVIYNNCIYCNREPSNVYTIKYRNESKKYSGIDRLDNNLGYEIGNCVPCCQSCNSLKNGITPNMVHILYNLYLETGVFSRYNISNENEILSDRKESNNPFHSSSTPSRGCDNKEE